MSSNQTMAVMLAAAQSVGKVFVIGLVGYCAVLYPKQRPLLPVSAVPALARFSFLVLTMALIFGTTAQSISLDTIRYYWFVVVASFAVIAIAYTTATVLGRCCFGFTSTESVQKQQFTALRIAATFPNIVALPILIFPSLCEYKVVYEGYAMVGMNEDNVGENSELQSLADQCIANSNAMIFCYFFSWSLVFWVVGYPQLMAVATANVSTTTETNGAAVVGDIDNDPPTDAATTLDPNSQTCEETRIGASKTTTMTTLDPACAATEVEADDNAADDGFDAVILVVQDWKGVSSTAAHAAVENAAASTGTPTSRSEPQLDGTSTNLPTPVPVSSGSSSSSPSCCLMQKLTSLKTALVQTVTSPGFVSLAAGVATGCIPPLQRTLFAKPDGMLTFLGDALQTMGQASTAISVMVVAASLVPEAKTKTTETIPAMTEAQPASSTLELDMGDGEDISANHNDLTTPTHATGTTITNATNQTSENPIMSDPNFGTFRRRLSMQQMRHSVRRRSTLLSSSFRRRRSSRVHEAGKSDEEPEQAKSATTNGATGCRILIWYCLSSLIVSPAIAAAVVTLLDCYFGAVLADVPPLAKLVVIINSCLPGALIVVVLLKSNPAFADTAASVAKVYLPSYLLSILTIAAWTTIGLYVTVPDENGLSLCQRTR